MFHAACGSICHASRCPQPTRIAVCRRNSLISFLFLSHSATLSFFTVDCQLRSAVRLIRVVWQTPSEFLLNKQVIRRRAIYRLWLSCHAHAPHTPLPSSHWISAACNSYLHPFHLMKCFSCSTCLRAAILVYFLLSLSLTNWANELPELWLWCLVCSLPHVVTGFKSPLIHTANGM